MFTWICPKCKGEVPPSYDDCPRCAPKAAPPPPAPARVEESTPGPVYAAPAAPPAAPFSNPAWAGPGATTQQPQYLPAQYVQPAAPPAPPAYPAYPQEPPPTGQGYYVQPPPPHPAAPPPPPPPQAPPPVSFGGYAPAAPPPPPAALTLPVEGGARQISPTMAGLGAAAGVVVLLGLLYTFVLPHNGDRAAAEAKGDAVRLEEPQNAGAAGAAGSRSPFAKHLEVSGVRVQESSGGKVKIDFVVINHSSAELPDLKMNVRIRSGDRDYFVVPVSLPSLGPFEAKDMSTSAKTNLKPYELPDWQMIKPVFTITSE